MSLEPPGVAVGTIDPLGNNSGDGSVTELVGACDNEGKTETFGS